MALEKQFARTIDPGQAGQPYIAPTRECRTAPPPPPPGGTPGAPPPPDSGSHPQPPGPGSLPKCRIANVGGVPVVVNWPCKP